MGITVITVARKPVSEGSVAENVLKWGTGGIDIDGARVGTTTRTNSSKPSAIREVYAPGEGGGGFVGGTTTQVHDHGRWPSNLVFGHLPDCRTDGVKKVKPSNGSGVAHGKYSSRDILYGEWGGGKEHPQSEGVATYVGADGTESVPNWICGPGCPVAGLDCQSGSSKGGDEEGGASRFFKQVKSDE
jgi:hypothetical protein